MRQLLNFIYIGFIITTFIACEGKHNCNGDLDGNWQLTSWKCNSDGSIKATNKDGIYYAVSLNLVKIWASTQARENYLLDFTLRNDSLILLKAYASPFDSIVSFKSLKDYGVSEDGKFKIGTLNSRELVLINNDNTLFFRKY